MPIGRYRKSRSLGYNESLPPSFLSPFFPLFCLRDEIIVARYFTLTGYHEDGSLVFLFVIPHPATCTLHRPVCILGKTCKVCCRHCVNRFRTLFGCSSHIEVTGSFSNEDWTSKRFCHPGPLASTLVRAFVKIDSLNINNLLQTGWRHDRNLGATTM